MSESQLYELLGRKQARLEQLAGDNRALLALLHAIKDGRVRPEAVLIDGDRVEVVAAEAVNGTALEGAPAGQN